MYPLPSVPLFENFWNYGKLVPIERRRTDRADDVAVLFGGRRSCILLSCVKFQNGYNCAKPINLDLFNRNERICFLFVV